MWTYGNEVGRFVLYYRISLLYWRLSEKPKNTLSVLWCFTYHQEAFSNWYLSLFIGSKTSPNHVMSKFLDFTPRTLNSFNESLILCKPFSFHLSSTGGYDGQDFLKSVECYDAQQDTWSEITSMSSGRSGAGVAVGMEPCRLGGLCSNNNRELRT